MNDPREKGAFPEVPRSERFPRGSLPPALCMRLVPGTAGGCVCARGACSRRLSVLKSVLSAAEALTMKLCVLQWGPEDGPPSSCSGGLGEEVLYDNAVLYDNLPPPEIFARCPPADRRAPRLSADKLSCNHYKHPASCAPPSAQSVTNTSSVGRASLGLGSQVQHCILSYSRTFFESRSSCRVLQ